MDSLSPELALPGRMYCGRRISRRWKNTGRYVSSVATGLTGSISRSSGRSVKFKSRGYSRGSARVDYRYSGLYHPARAMPPALRALQEKVERVLLATSALAPCVSS